MNGCFLKLGVKYRRFQIVVIEESHIGFGFFPGCQILSGLFSATTDSKNGLGIRRVLLKLVCKIRIKLLGPFYKQAIYRFRIHFRDFILGYIRQLGIVKEVSGRIQLFGAEFESGSRSRGIGSAPVFVVGV